MTSIVMFYFPLQVDLLGHVQVVKEKVQGNTSLYKLYLQCYRFMQPQRVPGIFLVILILQTKNIHHPQTSQTSY